MEYVAEWAGIIMIIPIQIQEVERNGERDRGTGETGRCRKAETLNRDARDEKERERSSDDRSEGVV